MPVIYRAKTISCPRKSLEIKKQQFKLSKMGQVERLQAQQDIYLGFIREAQANLGAYQKLKAQLGL